MPYYIPRTGLLTYSIKVVGVIITNWGLTVNYHDFVIALHHSQQTYDDCPIAAAFFGRQVLDTSGT